MPDLKKMTTTKGKQMPHIGNAVQSVLQKKRWRNADLARELNVSSGNIQKYLEQNTLHAALLWKIGQALNFNFFEWLAKEFPPLKEETEEVLQKQIDALQKENELYKKMLEK